MTRFLVVWPAGGTVDVWADGYRTRGDELTFWAWHDPYGDVWQHDIGTVRGPWVAVLAHPEQKVEG